MVVVVEVVGVGVGAVEVADIYNSSSNDNNNMKKGE